MGDCFWLTVLYVFGFVFLMPIFGPVTLALSGFPIAAVGWYFGLAGGVIASLIIIMFNFLLMTIFRGIPWHAIDQGSFFLGSFILIIIGISFGQMKKSFEGRIQTENQLVSRERYHVSVE